VSVRRVLGWEPGEVTTFEYDEQGRMVRSVTVREAEFSAWDRALLFESIEAERQPRGSHGWPISAATDPANMGRFKVSEPTTDFAAKALHDAQKAWRDQHGEQAGMDNLLWKVDLSD